MKRKLIISVHLKSGGPITFEEVTDLHLQTGPENMGDYLSISHKSGPFQTHDSIDMDKVEAVSILTWS